MKTTERIKKLEECGKLKDKRIRNQHRRIQKLENKGWVRNRVILSVLFAVLLILPFVLLFIYGTAPEIKEFVKKVLTGMGIGVWLFGTVVVYILSLIKIWKEGD